jgi:two-component system phosphate regulon response regulator PhoB
MSKALQPTVLVVEDEESISAVIKYNLKKEGFNVQSCDDGVKAVEIAKKIKPDVILLDWMVPSMSGLDVCKELRSYHDTVNIPVIMVTAKSSEFDKVSALEAGADDYVTKPFSVAEMIARVKAVLRRIRPAFSGKVIEFKDIKIDMLSHKTTRNGTEVELSPIEFNILLVLLENPGRVLSREDLMSKIWGGEMHVGSRTIDVHITRLRKALLKASADNVDVIKTVRLSGYAIDTTDGLDSK